MEKRIRIRVGLAGWQFDGWRNRFYPKDIKRKDELAYFANKFSTVEVNGTFYSLQKPKTFQTWYDATPEDFVFCLKGGRFITHVLRLREGTELALANFFASGILCLGEKLGPILWQFPKNVMWKDDRFERFFAILPRSHSEAEALARKHGTKVEGRAHVEAMVQGPIRHVFEFRHGSFFDPKFVALMHSHRVGLVGVDTAGTRPELQECMSEVSYFRFHGLSAPQRDQGYGEEEIGALAERVCRTVGRSKDTGDCFVFFDNEHKDTAPENAIRFCEKIEQTLTKRAS